MATTETPVDILRPRVGQTTVGSGLVNPDDNGYDRVVKLDKEWVERKVMLTFGGQVREIENKNVIRLLDNQANPILVYNHNGQYWLVTKSL